MPGSFIIGIVSAVVLAVLLGGVLLAVGWRGRRVGRHPVCARCGFELSGIPVTPEAGRPPCPECGCALDDPKSIAIGSRRRRPVVALVGAVLLIGGLAVGGGVAVLASGSPAFMPYKPVALLAWAPRWTSPPPPHRHAVLSRASTPARARHAGSSRGPRRCHRTAQGFV